MAHFEWANVTFGWVPVQWLDEEKLSGAFVDEEIVQDGCQVIHLGVQNVLDALGYVEMHRRVVLMRLLLLLPFLVNSITDG